MLIKFLNLVKLLLIVAILSGCNPPDKDMLNNTNKDNFDSYKTSLNKDTVAKPVPNPGNNTSSYSEEATGGTGIEIHKTFDIEATYVSTSYIQEGKIYKGSPVEISVKSDRIFLVKTDGPVQWSYKIPIDQSNWTIITNNYRIGLANNNVIIYLTHDYRVMSIFYDGREYITNKELYNKTIRKKNTLKSKVNRKSNKLSYMEKYSVKVKPGNNLKYLVQKYNDENGTSLTLREVIELNPWLKRRKNYTIMPGDIIRFNKYHE